MVVFCECAGGVDSVVGQVSINFLWVWDYESSICAARAQAAQVNWRLSGATCAATRHRYISGPGQTAVGVKSCGCFVAFCHCVLIDFSLVLKSFLHAKKKKERKKEYFPKKKRPKMQSARHAQRRQRAGGLQKESYTKKKNWKETKEQDWIQFRQHLGWGGVTSVCGVVSGGNHHTK